MASIGSIGVAIGMAFIAYGALWVSRRPVPKLQGAWGLLWQIVGVASALGAGGALRTSGVLHGPINSLAGAATWVPWLFGVIVWIIPLVLIIAVIPGWPIAISELLVTVLIVFVSLQAFAFHTGHVPALSAAVARFAMSVSDPLTGWAF